jgi:hypothetical protein
MAHQTANYERPRPWLPRVMAGGRRQEAGGGKGGAPPASGGWRRSQPVEARSDSGRTFEKSARNTPGQFCGGCAFGSQCTTGGGPATLCNSSTRRPAAAAVSKTTMSCCIGRLRLSAEDAEVSGGGRRGAARARAAVCVQCTRTAVPSLGTTGGTTDNSMQSVQGA